MVMRLQFFVVSFVVFFLIGIGGYLFWNPIYLLFLIVGPIFILGLYDLFQTKKAVIRNFPVIGHLRYFFEMIRPEIQQYFVENDIDGMPINRELRSVVYQRAKNQLDTIPFGTIRNVYEPGYEWVNHSIAPKVIQPESLRVTIGSPDCSKPYSASVLNISAMSYGSLSRRAILSLNGGAKLGNFYHNTGEGGFSHYHREPGGDIVWQIGTGYFGCRTPDGRFDSEKFKDTASSDQVKMIEIKISQGAKPAHGGILPAVKITEEIAEIRGVPMGKDVNSPPDHKEFSDPIGLLKFVERLRTLANGKPVGFKLCLGHRSEFIAICKAMLETKIYPDYIAVDGGEGGTGAAPLEFSNRLGNPLDEGLVFVHDTLVGYNLKRHIKLIVTGKIFTSFQILNKAALGADIAASARGMMLALGCIQARKCNTNHCPVGVATQNPSLVEGLHVPSKTTRVFNYHTKTIKALAELTGAIGVESLDQVTRKHILRRITKKEFLSYEDLFPSVLAGDFLDGKMDSRFKPHADQASASTFQPV